jgi:hypothetical protein
VANCGYMRPLIRAASLQETPCLACSLTKTKTRQRRVVGSAPISYSPTPLFGPLPTSPVVPLQSSCVRRPTWYASHLPLSAQNWFLRPRLHLRPAKPLCGGNTGTPRGGHRTSSTPIACGSKTVPSHNPFDGTNCRTQFRYLLLCFLCSVRSFWSKFPRFDMIVLLVN